MKVKASQHRPIHLISCIGVDTEYCYLRPFVEHYRDIGIPTENFHLILNSEDESSPNLRRAIDLLLDYGITEPEVWISPYTSGDMWEKRRDIQARRVADEGWVVSADVDEFHEYPEQLAIFLAECESNRVNCVQGVFIDRVSEDGRLIDLNPDDDIWERFPLQADVQCTIGGVGEHHNWYGTVKLMAFSGGLFPARGGHFPIEKDVSIHYLFGRNIAGFPWIGQSWFRFQLPLRVHHFKWTASMPATLTKRHATSGVSPAGAEYGEKLLTYVDRNKGINIDDIPLRQQASIDRLGWRFRASALRAIDMALRFAGKSHRMMRNTPGKLTLKFRKR